MTTVDRLLLKIVNHTSPTVEEVISSRDSRVLRSLASAISSNTFITENQSRLMIKILSENCEKFEVYKDEIVGTLILPTWSKPFRVVDKTKKLYISNYDNSQVLLIEFAFSSTTRKVVTGLNNTLSGFTSLQTGKMYCVDLTEKNIIELVDTLSKLDFDIDEKIKNYYKIIKSWAEPDIRSQFQIDTITHTNFQKFITADLGINTAIDKNIINDRSIRYQYFTENPKNFGENLTEIIANRNSPRIWVNKKDTSLDSIIKSLIELKRFPVLIIFDPTTPQKCLDELTNLTKNLEENGITDNIGIYFRLDNVGAGKEFNQLIAKKGYNKPLDNTTKIAAVANGKIPKFLLKSGWTPMSVISIGKLLQHNKTFVYTNCCDLVINWCDNEPITQSRWSWQ
jgi:hypothetical protein